MTFLRGTAESGTSVGERGLRLVAELAVGHEYVLVLARLGLTP
jgi:hypothetical protein